MKTLKAIVAGLSIASFGMGIILNIDVAKYISLIISAILVVIFIILRDKDNHEFLSILDKLLVENKELKNEISNTQIVIKNELTNFNKQLLEYKTIDHEKLEDLKSENKSNFNHISEILNNIIATSIKNTNNTNEKYQSLLNDKSNQIIATFIEENKKHTNFIEKNIISNLLDGNDKLQKGTNLIKEQLKEIQNEIGIELNSLKVILKGNKENALSNIENLINFIEEENSQHQQFIQSCITQKFTELKRKLTENNELIEDQFQELNEIIQDEVSVSIKLLKEFKQENSNGLKSIKTEISDSKIPERENALKIQQSIIDEINDNN